MKRLLPITLGLVTVSGAALLIGPSFVDWNKYKPQIVEQAKSAAGYDVAIAGDINLSLIPSPQLKIEGLSMAAPRGREKNLLDMKQANVSVKLLPLISGNVVIDTVRLVNPNISLEVLPDGSNSWMSDKLLADQDAKTQSGGGVSSTSSKSGNIALEKLIIENGRVSYADRQNGKSQVAEEINIAVRADTLQGPYAASGTVLYNGKNIGLEAETKAALNGGKEIPADITVSLPDSKAEASFDGVLAMEPLEIQGKVDINAPNLGAALFFGKEKASPALAQKLSFSGLVTANEDRVQSQDIDITFGDTQGKGNVMMTNLKARNPVKMDADMTFAGILNFDQLIPAKDKSKEPNVEEKVAKGQKLSPNTALLPESISVPFPVDGSIRIGADGIQTGGKIYKGIVAEVNKTGSLIDIAAKALDIPGKTAVEIRSSVSFSTTSQSGEKGVTYADPMVTFTVVGNSEQLPTLLRSFAPDQDGNAALEIYKTAKFNLQGNVTGDAVKIDSSSVQLDQTDLALAAAYRPYGAAGRPDVAIDLTAGAIDLDHILSRLNGQKKLAVQKDPAAKTDVKKALEPVRSFEMPVNLTFDLSVQEAFYNQQKISGIRIKGKAAGQSVNLDVASAQDYMGAAASLKGQVANLKELSGIDASFYGKTDDLKSLMQAFKIDATKLPQAISGAEANVAAKGAAESLNFDAKLVALDGQLQASGNMTGLLTTPAFSNLTIGAQHPNLVKAIQIVNPEFSGGPGLEKPFSFNAKAVQDGNNYDLSGLKASLGPTSFNGNLKIATGGAKPSVSGNIDAGNIPFDSLLGAKNDAAGSSNGGSSSSAEGGKWSRSTIETGWMQTVNVDMGLSAQSITYGGWNFVKPSTQIVLKDGVLTVDKLQSGLFGGTATLNAKVVDPADPKQPLTLAVQSAMDKVDLEPLVTALSGTGRLKATGDVSLDFNVQSTGLSAHALMGALQGKANLNGNSVIFKGFDLAQIGLAFVDTGKPMDRINSIVGGATQSGETRFDTIKGVYDITQGIATITSMAMDGPAANIVSKGHVNLPQWTIDTIHTITFKQAKDAGAFDVAIKGSLNNPGNTFGRGLFNDVLTRRLQQKAIEKLPDVLGKDLGGKLQDLGILPKQQKAPVPQQAPVTEAAPPVSETDAQQAQPVQQEQPQQQDPAQKAIQGVLDGLLR